MKIMEIFDITALFIQYNTDSYCGPMTSGVNVHLYECVSRLTPECVVCLCVYLSVCVCDIKSEYQQKTALCVSPK